MYVSRFTRLSLAVALASLLVSPVAPARAAGTVPAAFTITGSGWGHGLGLSQYGAYGMAMDYLANPGKITPGCSDGSEASTNACIADDIIRHYYAGSTIGTTPQIPDFKVGILQDVATVYIKGTQLNGAGGILTLTPDDNAAAAQNVPAGTDVTISSGMTATWAGGSMSAASKIHVDWNGTAANGGSPGLFNLKTSATGSYKAYKYGSMDIMYGGFDDSSADLLVRNTLQLNTEYLYGLGEMPSSWSAAALQAQVIAARSYALVRYNKYPSLRNNCQCHIYDEINDQVFSGYSKESGSYGDKWVAAVNATGDGTNYKIAMSGGSVVDAFFSSSTGGATSPLREVWGTSGYPYLAMANDAWALSPDVRNPYATWNVTISQGTLVSRLNSYLGSQGRITDINAVSIAAKNASGAVSILDIADSGGNVSRIYVRPSSQWSSSTLDISPDNIRSLIGSAETRPSSSFNGSTYLSAIAPGSATTAASSATKTAKLTSASMSKVASKAYVESQLTFRGTTKPAQAAIKVELQYKSGSKWKTLATSQTDSAGRYSFNWGANSAGKKTIRVKASNSRNSVNTSSKTVSFSTAVSISGITKAARNTPVSLNGSTAPAKAGLTVVIERKVGTASWKKVGTVSTDEYGGWAFVSSTTSKKVTTQFRARLTNSKVGKATSKTIKVKVK